MKTDAEWRDLPALKLTPAQASRFWQFDPARSEALFESLVDAGVFRRAGDGSYLLATERNLQGVRRALSPRVHHAATGGNVDE